MVATAALRAGLEDVDLRVLASWPSTRRWPGPGRAAGLSWSLSSTRTCSWSMWWPRPRYAPAWTWICVSGPAGQAWAAQRRRRPQLVAELDPGLQLLDVVAMAALRAGLVDVDLRVWASRPGLGRAAAPPAAAGR
ncbi:hypothetical protein A4F85_01225 [Delftia sp. GW456-R20]|uniref:hypothetical protein n=1 Tax=Delftia sp. GW456-R20 TaxID=1827145 RepID=UPI0007AE8C47|nr:hypothetical protein [Delftia sp. GW456-R20]KZK32409.1 hypothetical protein A4F85_01225 [Delftia sp. GW456-R20]